MLLPVVIDRCKYTHTHTHTRYTHATHTLDQDSKLSCCQSAQSAGGQIQEGILVLRVTLGSLSLWDPNTVQPPNPPVLTLLEVGRQ